MHFRKTVRKGSVPARRRPELGGAPGSGPVAPGRLPLGWLDLLDTERATTWRAADHAAAAVLGGRVPRGDPWRTIRRWCRTNHMDERRNAPRGSCAECRSDPRGPGESIIGESPGRGRVAVVGWQAHRLRGERAPIGRFASTRTRSATCPSSAESNDSRTHQRIRRRRPRRRWAAASRRHSAQYAVDRERPGR